MMPPEKACAFASSVWWEAGGDQTQYNELIPALPVEPASAFSEQ